METRSGGRILDVATALALGVVSLVTALGVLQAGAWNSQADRLADDSADARDQGISIAVVAQLRQRSDLSALLEARPFAEAADVALAAGDLDAALLHYTDVVATITPAYLLPEGSFDTWWAAGFPEDARPTDSADYLVASRGPADALSLVSRALGDNAAALQARSAVFGQAALVNALALFFFGIAGINRLRSTRYATLVIGSLVFLFGLILMSTAY